MKIEISNRQWNNHYERKNLLGINMQVMVAPDMFAHKLCALLDRGELRIVISLIVGSSCRNKRR
jgi:hypothetical protein